jgi:hypothetical protein
VYIGNAAARCSGVPSGEVHGAVFTTLGMEVEVGSTTWSWVSPRSQLGPPPPESPVATIWFGLMSELAAASATTPARNCASCTS